jgi:hypothetical protein
MNNAGLVGKPHHFCEWVILPNHPHEIYEVCVLTGNCPLLSFNIQQDEGVSDIRGASRMLKLVYLVDLVDLVCFV